MPIALVEQLAGPRRSTPWLRWPGLTVAWVLFVIIFIFTLAQFRAQRADVEGK